VERHLEWMRLRGMSPLTIQRRRAVLLRLRAALPHGGLLAASPAELQAWRASLTVAPDAVAVYVSHVRRFYAWAVADGLLPASPAATLPAPPRSWYLPRPIGEQELLEAVAAAPPRIRPWLVLAGWAGLRAKEIALLRREHVLDSRNPPVLLVAAGATKGHHERLVPLSDFALAELGPHLPARGWVFPRLDGQLGPNTPARVSQAANRHLHDCGIPETLHQLRHRFATSAYAASHDLRVVQELLGHRSIRATTGYADYDRAAAIAAVQAIPAPRRRRVLSSPRIEPDVARDPHQETGGYR